MRFDGHVVLVTGAAKGIGLRIDRAFGRDGARVAALDIDAPGADALARELVAEGPEALALKADVTAVPEVRQATRGRAGGCAARMASTPPRSDRSVDPEPCDLRGLEPQLAKDPLGVLAEDRWRATHPAGVPAILKGTPSAWKGPAAP